jgi:hypothetical protein
LGVIFLKKRELLKLGSNQRTKTGIKVKFNSLSKDELIEELTNLKRDELIALLTHFHQDKDKKESHNSVSKSSKLPDIAHSIIPILPPPLVNIPEVYVIANSGTCLFHFDFLGVIKEDPIDKDLVSNFLGAMNMFAESLGWKSGVNSIKSGNNNIFFSRGEYIFVALSSQEISDKSSYQIEPVLADLAKKLCSYFEERYNNLLKRGMVCNMEDFKGFKQVLEEFFVDYRKDNFEMYQKLILVEALEQGVPEIEIIPLINKLTAGKTVIGELGGLMNKYPGVKVAIEKINISNYSMWRIFSTPIYSI